jgi:hypoxanthine phosphoribosyltransferase
MKEVKKIKDRLFKPYIPAVAIQDATARLAEKIQMDMEGKDPVFLVVLNGAFVFASDLFRQLDFPCRLSFIRLASYQGTQSSGTILNLIGLNEDLRGEHIVIVEDIIDTGHTLYHLLEELKRHQPASIRIATLLFKPQAFVHQYPVDYVAMEIPPEFIVGYGLDYDGYGRNLPDIYQIVNE